MKVLVCTDGSEQSHKALEKAALIAKGCEADEVVVIHVDEGKRDLSALTWGSEGYSVSDEDIKNLKRLHELHIEEKQNILQNALNYLKEKNLQANAILKQGHPAKTILDFASENGFDTIVIGSRGLGGWKKRILGSVSSAVVQEAKDCTVITVK